MTNNVVLYPITVALDTAPAGVKTGSTASLAITDGQATGVLEVPTAAITTVGTNHTVTVRRNGTDTIVPVGVGLIGATTTEITSGLAAGDVVVLPSADPEHADGQRARRRVPEAGRRPVNRGSRPVIALQSVSKIYGAGDTAVHAVDGVDLVVERGDYVAVMGASGSGKSTLMNIIGCLDVPSRGRYLLDGVDIRRLDEKRQALIRNRKIGFVFQSFNLIPRTSALSNVELPMAYAGVRPAERRQRALAALERVGLGARVGPPPVTNCPAASSSAWRSRGRSSPNRCCCWPTSRPARSTAPAPRTCWSCSTT